jgi:hypothetical protein
MNHRNGREQSLTTVPGPRPQGPPRLQEVTCNQRDGAERKFVHNHPSGDPTPSSADIQMTRGIVDIADPLGIVVHDHIIVGKNGHASLKGLKLM